MGDQPSTSKLNGITASGVNEEIIDLTDSPDVYSLPLTRSGQRASLDDSVIILSDVDSPAAPSGPGSRSLSNNPTTSLISSDGFGAKDTGTSTLLAEKSISAGPTAGTGRDPFQSVATSSSVVPSTSGSFGGLRRSTTAIQSGQQTSMQGDGGGGNSGAGHPSVLLKSASIPVVMIPRCAAPISTKGHAVPADPNQVRSSQSQPGTAVVSTQSRSHPELFSSSVSPGDSAGLCRSMGVSAMLGTLLPPQLMHPSTSKNTGAAGGIQGMSLPSKTLSDPGPSTSKSIKDSQQVSSFSMQVSAKKASDNPEPMDIDPDQSPVPVTTAQLAKSTSASALQPGSISTVSAAGSQASGWTKRLRAVPSRRMQQQPAVGQSASHSNTNQLGPAKGIGQVAKPADGSGLFTIVPAIASSQSGGPAQSGIPGSVDNGSKSAEHVNAVSAQSVPIDPVKSSLVNSNKVDAMAPNSVKYDAQTCDQKSTSACSSSSAKDKDNSFVASGATTSLSQTNQASSSHTSNSTAISGSGSSSSGVALSLPAATAARISSTGAATNATTAAAATRTQKNLLLFDEIRKAQINARPQLIAHRRVKGNRYLNTAFHANPDKPNAGAASSKSAKSKVQGAVVGQKNTKMDTAAASGSKKEKGTSKKNGVDVEFSGSHGNPPATRNSNGWICRQCTFINHPDLGRCEMCELPMEDSLDSEF